VGSRGPLDGITVVDLTHALSGPYCTLLLSEMGARVIKVEHAPAGDTGRFFPPIIDGQPEFFTAMNHGKESILADLGSAEDRPVLEAMIRAADVVVENFRPGALDAWGWGWDAVRELNPSVVYASITGFGQTGPESWEGAFDVVIQAEAGLMSVTGFPDGPPVMTGTSVADYLSGTYAFGAIAAALVGAKATGEGARIDIAMFDSVLGILGAHVFDYLGNQTEPQRSGNLNPLATPFEIYEAADGSVAICAPMDAEFVRLAAALDRPAMATDPRFADPASRVEHRFELRAAIDEMIGSVPRDELVDRLQRAGIPAGVVRTVPEALDSAQAHARNMVIGIEGTHLRIPHHPLRLSTVDDPPTRPRAATLDEQGAALRREFLGDS
jgi:CoA:oxalate CoA-transferase